MKVLGFFVLRGFTVNNTWYCNPLGNWVIFSYGESNQITSPLWKKTCEVTDQVFVEPNLGFILYSNLLKDESWSWNEHIDIPNAEELNTSRCNLLDQ